MKYEKMWDNTWHQVIYGYEWLYIYRIDCRLMNGRVSEWVNEWQNNHKIIEQQKNEWMYGWLNKEKINKWANKWIIKWMNQSINE